MAESIGNGNRAVGIEAGLVADGIGDGDRAIAWVTPVLVLLAAEDVFQCLINPWAGIDGNRCAKEVECGLNNRQRAPTSSVGVIDSTGADV